MSDHITIEVDIPDEAFFYLAGPMTDYPQHNFPEFERVSTKLREFGYTICTPHDLDSPIYDEVIAGDGTQPHLRSDAPLGLDLLRRDVNIVMHPYCVGIICLPGWEGSFGAKIETFIGAAWDRPLFDYTEDEDGKPVLVTIDDRDDRLRAHQRAQRIAASAERAAFSGHPLALDTLGAMR